MTASTPPKPNPFTRITVLSVTTLGAIASLVGILTYCDARAKEMPEFERDSVAFNEYSPNNDAFLAFLRKHDAEKVRINTLLDFSPIFEEHFVMLHDCNLAYNLPGQSEEAFKKEGGTYTFQEGRIYNRDIGLPHRRMWEGHPATVCNSTLQVRVEASKEVAPTTHGGTGMNQVRLQGHFVIHQEISGATERLILRQVDEDAT